MNDEELYARVDLAMNSLAEIKRELHPRVFPSHDVGELKIGWEIFREGKWRAVVTNTKTIEGKWLVQIVGLGTVAFDEGEYVTARYER